MSIPCCRDAHVRTYILLAEANADAGPSAMTNIRTIFFSFFRGVTLRCEVIITIIPWFNYIRASHYYITTYLRTTPRCVPLSP